MSRLTELELAAAVAFHRKQHHPRDITHSRQPRERVPARRRARGACAALFVASLSACASASGPRVDATPLASASSQVYEGFIATQALVAEELDAVAVDVDCPVDDGDAGASETPGECFERIWQPRMEVVRAFVGYAERLAAALDARSRDGSSASGVLAAAAELFHALGLPGIPGAVSRAVASFYEPWQETRSAATAGEALARADPHIQALVAVLVADLGDVREIVTTLRARLVLERIATHNDELALRRQRELAQRLAAGQVEPASAAAELAAIAGVLSHLPTRAGLVPARLDAALHMLTATRTALTAWGQAHADLAAALRDRRPPALGALLPRVRQIRTTWTKSRSDQ